MLPTTRLNSMSNFNGIEFYVSQFRNRFDTSAEPTAEDVGAVSSTNRTIADGDQVADIVDGSPDARLTVGTDLITGDDSTFDSDTGNWTLGAGFTIAGGKLVLTNVAVGVEASITVPFTAATYETIFTTTGLSGGTEGLRIEVGDANGTETFGNSVHTEDLSPTSGTTVKIQVTTGPVTGTVDNVKLRLKDKYRFDMAADRRARVDGYHRAGRLQLLDRGVGGRVGHGRLHDFRRTQGRALDRPLAVFRRSPIRANAG